MSETAEVGAVAEDELVEGQQETEEIEGEKPEKSEAEPEDSDEVTVTIGDESPPSDDAEKPTPEWIGQLRKSNDEKNRQLREKDRRIRELEQAQKANTDATKATELGKKPSLEDCEYDTEKFEQELEAWHQRKQVVNAEVRKKESDALAAKAAWQAKLDGYGKAKAELKVKDYEDAEAVATESLSIVQQGVILNGAAKPELLIYALGKNPKKLKELSAITDPVQFAFAAANLERDLKVSPKKVVPAPERVIQGQSGAVASADKKLDALYDEAARTGRMDKVRAYKRQLRESGKN